MRSSPAEPQAGPAPGPAPARAVPPPPPREPLRVALAIQLRTLEALAVRFLVTRYGRENIGFVWAILEPMLLCIAVMLLWSVAKPTYEHGIHVVGLVLTGYMPLTLWRHLSNAGVHGLRQSKNLRYHRNVTYLDAIVSRLALEFVTTTAALIVATSALMIIGLVEPIHDYGLVLAGWLLMGALGFGFGLFLAGLTELSETAEKFVQPIQYIIVPISGVFFMVGWLPQAGRELIVWVPHVHSYEAIRAGFFGSSVRTYEDLGYGFGWALSATAFGFIMIRLVRDRVR